MPDTPPQIIVLKDLESITEEFVCARPFKFELREFPGKHYEVQIKPLTQAQLAEAYQFTQFVTPKKQKLNEKSGLMEDTDEEDLRNLEWIREVNEKFGLRRAYIFQHGLPEIKFKGENTEAIAKEIKERFPDPYSVMLENEILRQSTNQVAIINLANFSASDGSAQS
jgi:hypothetical protein